MSKLDSIEFYELIGAPLLGFVQAEHQAAQATLEMVEQLGFEQTPTGRRIRTTRFFSEKPGPDGQLQRVEHQIPTLTLLQIPMMQTKHAELEFGVKINDFEMTAVQGELAGDAAQQGFMAPRRLQMKASLGRLEQNQRAAQNQLDMRVKLSIEPADFPNGITQLLRLMDEQHQSRPLPVEQEHPDE